MERLPQNKNHLKRYKQRIMAGIGLTALAASLYAGDRVQYDGEVWVGDRHALDVRFLSHGRSASLPPAGDFSVATYNVKHGTIDRAGVIKTARSLDATVLGLTESTSGIARSIAGSDYQMVTGPAGNTLLSKLPVKRSFSLPLPHAEDEGARAALFAQVDLGNQDAWFVVTHLSHNEWPSSARNMRLYQLVVLNQAIQERIEGSPIVMGDFNFEPHSVEYEVMDRAYDDGLSELGLTDMETFRGGLGLKRYDYMFVSERLGYHAIAGGRDDSEASDHMPIMMVLAADSGRGSLPATPD